MCLQVGQKLPPYNLNPSFLGAPLEPRNAEAPRIFGAVIRSLGPLLAGAEPGSPSPRLEEPLPRPQRSQECALMEGWPVGRPQSGLSPSSVSEAEGDKGLSGRRIPPDAFQAASLPAGPGDHRGDRRQAPRGSGALRLRRDGPSHDRDRGAQGFGPTDGGLNHGLAELAPPWLYLLVVDYCGPVRPQSGSRSSAAAAGAHGNAAGTPGQCSSRRYRPRPSNCRHAPDDRFCHAPSHGNPPVHWAAQPLLY